MANFVAVPESPMTERRRPPLATAAAIALVGIGCVLMLLVAVMVVPVISVLMPRSVLGLGGWLTNWPAAVLVGLFLATTAAIGAAAILVGRSVWRGQARALRSGSIVAGFPIAYGLLGWEARSRRR